MVAFLVIRLGLAVVNGEEILIISVGGGIIGGILGTYFESATMME